MVSLALDPPPSSHHPRSSGAGLRLALALVVALIAFGAGFWAGRATAPEGEAPASPREVVASAAPAPPAAPMAAPAPAGEVAQGVPVAPPVAGSAPVGAAAAPQAPAAPVAPVANPARRTVVTLSGALEESIAAALGVEDRALAEELSAVVNRLLVWDLRVSRDARKGDRLEIVWTTPAPAAPGVPVSREPVVDALRYASSKLGTVISAYRYQATNDSFPRYYRADGSELESRLVGGPIGDYEQVTSLLRDGRRHKGVDFKTPVGSPVLAPFDGVIARRNWNFSGNGNCLDVRDPATGRRAIFLHLDVLPKEMGVGRRVTKGQVIAASGNSGRSYAPHLHYQLEDASGKVLDPFDVHRTERRVLPAAEKPAFEAMRTRLDAALNG
jgi:murein DD-endopeptidase MepM/ murein hydrolase activator NlpD